MLKRQREHSEGIHLVPWYEIERSRRLTEGSCRLTKCSCRLTERAMEPNFQLLNSDVHQGDLEGYSIVIQSCAFSPASSIQCPVSIQCSVSIQCPVSIQCAAFVSSVQCPACPTSGNKKWRSSWQKVEKPSQHICIR